MNNKENIVFKKDKENKIYWASKKINNKTCVIGFYEDIVEDDGELYYIYEVCFSVGRNRKQCFSYMLGETSYLDNKISGNGSISYLIFAYESIKQFETFIYNEIKNKNITILIRATDEKRYNVYKYYLGKIGYETTNVTNYGWSKNDCIFKILKGNKLLYYMYYL